MEIIIYIISDSSGDTAEIAAKASVSQFKWNDGTPIYRKYNHVKTPERAHSILLMAAKDNAPVFYTIVNPKIRNYISSEAEGYGIPTVDVLTPGVEAIANHFNTTPTEEIGNLRKLDADYFKRVAAVEFAVQYDDGKDPSGFEKADIVILGVSRSSKTPLSMYLANKNLKVANLPLAPEVPVPKIIFTLPRKKIFGLLIKPENLNIIRTQRLKTMGAEACGTNYANPNRLLEELEYAEKLYKKIGCRVIDVSNKAIEETAGCILSIINKNPV